jgi:hypothetical protein
MPTNPSNCRGCGSAVTSTQKFCTKCGEKLPAGTGSDLTESTRTAEKSRPQIDQRGRKWDRQPDELGVRLDLWRIDGWFHKWLEVDAGTKAILLAEGRSAEVVGAGRYELKKFRGIDEMSAVLVDAADAVVSFTVPGLYAADGVEVAVACELVVEVADPTLFYAEFMKGRALVTRAHLADEYTAEVKDALAELVGKTPFGRLESTREAKDDYELGLTDHMRTSFMRIGVELLRIRSLEFIQPDMLEVRRQESENKVNAQRVGVLEERARVREALMSAENLERIASMRSQSELDQVRREIDAKQSIDSLEWQKMLAVAQENEQDRELARRHMTRMLEEERSHELEMLRLAKEKEATGAKLDIEETKATRGQDMLDDMKARGRARDREERAIAREDDLERQRAEVEREKELIELQKDMTPEQIMALKAEKSPEIAKALAERFRTESSRGVAPGGKECSECGKACPANAKFCTFCGASFSDA